jgi:integrase
MTFGQCAEAYITAHRPSWRNADHSMQWQSSLRNYVLPIIGQLNVADIDTAHVMKCLEPIWTEKTETASRVRGRVELVLDWAAARGFRKGENPARWKGHIQNLLPKTSKTKKVTHHAALPYAEIGTLMAKIEPLRSSAAWALRFLILTAARTGEVLKATWDEIDLDRGMWTIPGERMKSGREHRVALSGAAVALLKALPRDGDYVFPGPTPDRPQHHLSMRLVLKSLGRDSITIHGFRSTFRDWAAEQTNFPRELAEMALAHAVGDKVEAAYRRSDLFEKRRKLADAWAAYCAKPTGAKSNVTPIRAVADA